MNARLDAPLVKELRHFHMCCGLGGGKKGFNKSRPRVGKLQAVWRCIGGVDNDPAAIRDFDNAGPGRKGTVLDLFSREQYIAFHGKLPPPDWREATPQDIRDAAGGEIPSACFISSPCKGLSGLLSQALSLTAKYGALNELTLRCIWLMCEAWADSPVPLLIFENVPKIQSRGRHLLDQIAQLLGTYGYAMAESTHDCGELGQLAQSRKRFLMVARHTAQVPSSLYVPEKKRLRAVGDVLGRMPMPGDPAGGPMHRIPNLQWKTWVRLAFVEQGGDWRSLNKLIVEDGKLRDYLIVPEYIQEVGRGVGLDLSAPSGGSLETHGVTDPRTSSTREGSGHLGVRRWEEPSGTVTGNGRPGAGSFTVADPRGDVYAAQNPAAYGGGTHKNVFRVERRNELAGTVTSGRGRSSVGGCVADPTPVTTNFGNHFAKPPILSTQVHLSRALAANETYSVEDPRSSINSRTKGDHYLTGGHYGVVNWASTSGAVSAAACHDNGRWSVADPRAPLLPAGNDKLVAIIKALDGTWHRPFTTLELAALQSLIDPEEHWSADPKIAGEIARMQFAKNFQFDGNNDGAWRERIGNAVPPDAATAIADVMGHTLLLAATGETFVLSAMPIWVQPLAIAMSVSHRVAA